MNKKWVRLEIVLVLVLFIFVDSAIIVTANQYTVPCDSYPYTFSRTSSVTDGKWWIKDPPYTQILNLAASFRDGRAPSVYLPQITAFEYQFKSISRPDCSMAGYGFDEKVNWDSGDTPAIMIGGYVYSSIPLHNLSVFVYDYWGGVNSFDAYVVVGLYNLTGFPLGTADANSYISPSYRIAYNGTYDIDDTSRSFGSTWGDGTVTTKMMPINVGPGVYYLVSGFAGDAPSAGASHGSHVQIEPSFEGNYPPLDSNGYPTPLIDAATNNPILGRLSQDFSDQAQLYSVDDNGNGYVISHNPLTVDQAKYFFKNKYGTVQWYCTLLGGDFNAGVGCCGVDASDEGKSATDATTGKNYTCSNKKWYNTDLNVICSELASPLVPAYAPIYPEFPNLNQAKMNITKNGGDNCCGDDVLSSSLLNVFGYDYGYIAPDSKQYMCYNYFSDLDRRNVNNKTNEDWSWLNAKQSSFDIYTLNNSGKIIDTISNGDSWYYCNANTAITSGLLNGIPLAGGESPQAAGGNNTVSCIDVMNIVFSNETSSISFVECNGVDYSNCCNPPHSNPTSYSVPLNAIKDCASYCYIGSKLVSSTDAMSYYSGFVGSSATTLPDYYDKASCLYNLSGCLNETIPSTETCTSLNGVVCPSDNNYCLGGKIVASSDSASCCYGYGTATKCKPKQSITTAADCSDIYGGVSYDVNIGMCNGQNVPIGTTGKDCCFSTVVRNQDLFGTVSLFAGASPIQFMCYKDYTGNLLAQCIFDNSSKNVYKTPTNELDLSRGILRGMGSSLHVVNSFDTFGSNGLVVDRVRRLTITKGSSSEYKEGTGEIRNDMQSFLLSGYTYLEFDVAYPTATCNLKVVLRTQKSDAKYVDRELDMCSYLTTGDRSKRWNHVVIPLKQLSISSDETYHSLMFRDYSTATPDSYSIVLDSITLSAADSADLSVNTANYYCTGGFGTWIPSLNPSSSTNFSDWNSYGPYKFACEEQASYAWTGQHCCGYNTRVNYDTESTYGEFFNDTEKGCFNGSEIRNDWSVSYINNVRETMPATFEAYNYKDIMYYNYTFVGCQVNMDATNGKYAALTKSVNGIQDTSTDAKKIVTQSVNSQCTVLGSYYCANNAWRQLIKIDAGGTINEKDFSSQQLLLKTAPSGPELIKNGFRG